MEAESAWKQPIGRGEQEVEKKEHPPLNTSIQQQQQLSYEIFHTQSEKSFK